MSLKDRVCSYGHKGYYAIYNKHAYCAECNRQRALAKYHFLKEKYKNSIPDKPSKCRICNSTDLRWYSTRYICNPCNNKRRRKLYSKNKLFNYYKAQEKNEKLNNSTNSTSLL